ncbi:hypothetical protein H8E07_18665 [bacterium]|nr:hypothetical protein [bacterium]
MELTWAIPLYLGPVLVVFAVAAGLWIRRHYLLTEPRAATARRRLLTGLRIAAVTLLIWALAGPSVLKLGRRDLPPTVIVVAEDSASMALRDAPGGARRWDWALRSAALVDSLLAVRAPDAEISHLRGNGLAGAAAWTRGADDAPPDGRGTDLGGLVSGLAREWSDRSLRAVVVLTDGHDTAAAPAWHDLAPAAGVEAVLVGIGDPVGPPDLHLQDLHYPDSAFQGDEIVVEATVGLRMMPSAQERPVSVYLVQAGDTLATATATPAADDESLRLELTFAAGRQGLNLYELIVAPDDNERYLANNRSSLAIAVRQERSRLLLLAGRPGWNVRALANAALAEPRLSLDVAHAGPEGLVLADSAVAWSPPVDAAGWRDWDGIVLAGTTGLDDALSWPALAEAVRGGLGLLVLPPHGPDGPPRALADVLPLRAGVTAATGQWLPVLTDGVFGHPLLSHLESASGETPFAALPPLQDLLRAQPGPDAVELLSARPLRGGAAALPLLLTADAGEGPVTWFASADLWSLYFWQLSPVLGDDRENAAVRLARNLLVWTAMGRTLSGVTIAGHRNLYREGEPIALETQGRDMRGEGRRQPVSLRLSRLEDGSGDEVRTFRLENVPGRPGRSRATLPPLPPARYEVQPVYAGTDSAAGPARPFLVVPSALEEMQTWQDQRHLRTLARRWGGVALSASVDDGLAVRLAGALDGIDWSPARVDRNSELSLWAGWPLLLLVLVLLGLEWILRRAEGML